MRMQFHLSVLVAAFFFAFTATPGHALEDLKLEGTAFLDQEACAKGLNAPDCVLSFSLSGQAAKTLFDGMKMKAVREECTGGMQKYNENGLNCIKYDDGTYTCGFGYDFGKEAFGGSHEDC